MGRLWRFALGQHCVNNLESGAFEVDASEIAACVDLGGDGGGSTMPLCPLSE
jgi:hypothetical protein